jgi:acetoin utilization deacetylase AcuC-like enzyme
LSYDVDEGLIGDPHQGLQLTTYSFQRVVEFILSLGKVPTLVLGGGGYNPPCTAKHFALLTGLVLGRTLDEDIPVEAEYWEELERDGGIHVGKDEELKADGEHQVDRLCAALKQKIEGTSV